MLDSATGCGHSCECSSGCPWEIGRLAPTSFLDSVRVNNPHTNHTWCAVRRVDVNHSDPTLSVPSPSLAAGRLQIRIETTRQADCGKMRCMDGTTQRNARHWRTVRVFVSSTFRDMHAERHALVRVVFPALRERLSRHRVHLIDVDLRWGVTREQAEHDGAVSVCLDQVDQCRPFFIGILGDRYGWVPRHVGADAVRRWPWLAEFAGRSVTELEMQHGALRQPRSASQAFFYFREPVKPADLPEDAWPTYLERDDDRLRLIADLKGGIRAYGAPLTDGYRCRWDPALYDTVLQRPGRLVLDSEFARRVEHDLWEGLRAHLGVDEEQGNDGRSEPSTEADLLEAEADDYERFVESRLQVYVGRDDIHRRLCEFAAGPARAPLAIVGAPGSGKSAVLARFVRERQSGGSAVIPHFVGASARSTSLRLMLRRLCLLLRDRLGLADAVPETTRELVSLFSDWVLRVSAEPRLVFVIDAIDQLELVDRSQELNWLPRELPPTVKIILSCAEDPARDQAALARIRARALPELPVPLLTVRERLGIIRHAPAVWAKTLDRHQRRALLQNPATSNPLYLLVAIEELRGFGSYEHLNERISSFPSGPDPVAALFDQVLDRLEHDFGSGLPPAMLRAAGTARRGISEQELRAALGSQVDGGQMFVVLRQLRPYLSIRGTLLSFFHSGLTGAVQRRYLGTDDRRRGAHATMAAFFGAMPDWTPTKSIRVPNSRRADELPWQYEQAGQWDQLALLLCSPSFLESKVEAGFVYDLLTDFTSALGAAVGGEPDRIIRVLNESMRPNAEFIARHPITLFQSVWNTAWWDGNPEANAHYTPAENAALPTGTPATQPTAQRFLEQWKAWKDESQPGHFWVRSLRPPLEPLGSGNDLTIRTQADRLFTVAFTADGTRVACAGRDRTIGIYDAVDGIEIARCFGHEHAINAVASAPGERIVSAADDGTVRCWSILTGDEIWRADRLQSVDNFAAPPPGQTMTAVIMRSLAVLGNNAPWTVGPAEKRFTSVACAGDGSGVAAAIGGNLMCLDPMDGRLIRHLWFTDHAIDSLAWSHDGRLIAVGVTDGTARLFDAVSLEERHRLPGHASLGGDFSVIAIAIDRPGRYVATGDFEGGVRLWHVPDGALVWAKTPDAGARPESKDVISSLAFTRDSAVLIVGSSGGRVRTLDAKTGDERRSRQLHSGWVRSVACSPASDLAASCGDDRVLRLFSSSDASRPQMLRGHSGIVGRIRYSKDGTLLSSATTRGDIIVWDAARATEQVRVKDPAVYAGGLAFSPDASRFAVSSNASQIRIFDTATGAVIVDLPDSHRMAATCIEYSPDGRLLASGSYDHAVLIQDAESGAGVLCLEGYQPGISALSRGRTSAILISGSKTGQVSVWDGDTGSLVRHLHGHASAVTCCAGMPITARVLSAAHDRTVRVWDIATGLELVTLTSATVVTCVACSPDETFLFSGAHDGTLCAMTPSLGSLFTAQEGAPVTSIEYLPAAACVAAAAGNGVSFRNMDGAQIVRMNVCEEGKQVRGMAWDPDEMHVMLLTSDSMLRIWNRTTAREIWSTKSNADSVALSPSGDIVALTFHATVVLWDVTNNTFVELAGHGARVTAVTFSADSSRVISASEDNTIRTWNTRTRDCLTTMRGPENIPGDVPFTVPYSRTVASDRGVGAELLDDVTRAVLMRVAGLAAEQMALPFSPDGRWLACVSEQNEVIVIDLAARAVRWRLCGHGGRVNALAFSADGRRLASGSRDKTVRVWDTTTGNCVQTYRGRGDVHAIANGAPAYPWLALVRSANETEIVSAATGMTVAWFPSPMLPIVTHPSGRMWCGVEYTKQFFLRLEGAESAA